MKRKQWVVLFFLLLGLLASLTLPAAAQGDDPQQSTPQPVGTPSDNEVNAVAKEMYCPVCENIPLDVCPTVACQEWREEIRQKLDEGWSEQQIKDYFATRYGDRVLAEPPRRGLNWLVYALPALFFAAGAVILWNVLRSSRAKAPGKTTASQPVAKVDQDPYLAKLEEELREKK